MHNLFLVSTAFQLINAIEAQNHFKTENNILVLLYYGNQNKDHEQLDKLVEKFDYSEIIIYNTSNKKRYLKEIILLIKKLRNNQYKYIFTGFFSANYRRFIANLTYQKLFLVDDGVYTIAIHNELYGNIQYGIKKYILPYSEKKRKTIYGRIAFNIWHNIRKLYLFVNGCKNEMENIDINFFTIFSLKQKENEIIVENRLNYVKSLFNIENDKTEESTMFFLGQPLKRAFSLDDDLYIQYLAHIFKYYSDYSKIIYIPHRAEEKKMIKRIKSSNLSHKLTVLNIDMPIELYVLENNIEIKHVSSFISTALFTLKKMYPEAIVDSVLIPIPEDQEKNVSLIYNQFKNDSINMIDIINDT